jgi:hypothetical protein
LAEKDEAGKWLNAKVGKQKNSAQSQVEHLRPLEAISTGQKGDQNVT